MYQLGCEDTAKAPIFAEILTGIDELFPYRVSPSNLSRLTALSCSNKVKLSFNIVEKKLFYTSEMFRIGWLRLSFVVLLRLFSVYQTNLDPAGLKGSAKLRTEILGKKFKIKVKKNKCWTGGTRPRFLITLLTFIHIAAAKI